MWYNYGALFEPGETIYFNAGGKGNFEERLSDDFFFERARKAGVDTSFDFILWASGTWDIFGSLKKWRTKMGDTWSSAPIGYDELAWHRKRLYEMSR